MKKIELMYNKLDGQVILELKNLEPQLQHIEKLVEDEASIYVDGRLVALYLKADFEMEELLKACNTLKFIPYQRSSGMWTNTINLNYIPRNPIRNNVCAPAKLNYEQPHKHKTFLRFAKIIAKSYRKYFSKEYSGQVKSSYVGKSKIHHSYLIKGTPFTGGVINKDCAMNYHFDAANTKDGVSCMLIMKENISGGELILPELNVGFSCQDNFMLLFDGQKYLHGVTKIIKGEGGYRYTIVYYNNKGMHLCLPPDEEFENYQNFLDRNQTNER